MSNKNYRTMDGIYKALLPIVNNHLSDYQIEKNRKDIRIFGNLYNEQPLYGTDIERLLPVLKRTCWMVRRNIVNDRVELLVWVYNDIV